MSLRQNPLAQAAFGGNLVLDVHPVNRGGSVLEQAFAGLIVCLVIRPVLVLCMRNRRPWPGVWLGGRFLLRVMPMIAVPRGQKSQLPRALGVPGAGVVMATAPVLFGGKRLVRKDAFRLSIFMFGVMPLVAC